MLEIICIIWLWKTNSRNAVARGQRPGRYRVLTLVLWLGLEFIGTYVGLALMEQMFPDKDPLIGVYIFGILGALCGGVLSYQITKHAPQGDYRPDQNSYGQGGCNQNPGSNGQNAWNQDSYGQSQGYNWNNPANGGDRQYDQPESTPLQPGMLRIPATVRIVEESGGYEGAQDSFFLNGFPACSLRPGSEYTFTTSQEKNILTIGRPTQPSQDDSLEVRFMAAENGYIEIHAMAGRLLPEKFKNYSS